MTSETVHADREHSSIVGGSSASKRLNCPGSYQMEQKLPPSDARESSKDADEGTALHECMQHILLNNIVDLEEIRGMTFGVSDSSPDGYVMTDKLIADAIVPCVAFFDDLDDRMQKEGGLTFLVEQRCQFPGIPNAFGTSDLVARSDHQTFIVDWKFGAGVPVKAYYNDSKTGEVKPNAQLMFYARAALHSRPEMFGQVDAAGNAVTPPTNWPVTLYIVQPRSRDDETYSERTVHLGDLDSFRMDLVRAVSEAQGPDPRIERGDHCRFARCKKICPLFTEPGFQLTQMHAKLTRMKDEPLGTATVEWNDLYARLLDYATLAELAAKEIHAGAHAFLETGEKIPGWHLVDKRGTAYYTDEQGAVKHAVKLGIVESQCFTMETKSPAQMRELITPMMTGATKKAREEAAKKAMAPFVDVKSSGTTLARADDGRDDAISASEVMTTLAAKLAALTGR